MGEALCRSMKAPPRQNYYGTFHQGFECPPHPMSIFSAPLAVFCFMKSNEPFFQRALGVNATFPIPPSPSIGNYPSIWSFCLLPTFSKALPRVILINIFKVFLSGMSHAGLSPEGPFPKRRASSPMKPSSIYRAGFVIWLIKRLSSATTTTCRFSLLMAPPAAYPTFKPFVTNSGPLEINTVSFS